MDPSAIYDEFNNSKSRLGTSSVSMGGKQKKLKATPLATPLRSSKPKDFRVNKPETQVRQSNKPEIPINQSTNLNPANESISKQSNDTLKNDKVNFFLYNFYHILNNLKAK